MAGTDSGQPVARPPAPAWYAGALAAAPDVGALDVDGCRIALRTWGERSQPGVVLVHGGGAHSRWVGPYRTLPVRRVLRDRPRPLRPR